ncbi:hypothetical protein L6R52_16870 [Myxococcota bacterium]|nr:hypothetical protein [Myxococcota bacterium]
MSSKQILACLALALAACEPGDPVVDDSASIAGVVTDAELGTPLAGVVVTTTPETERVETAADGTFAITKGTRIGATYQLTAEKTGFELGTAALTLVQGVNTANLALDVLRICTAGATRCALGGPEAIETCDARGTSWTATACGGGDVCDDASAVRCASAETLTVTREGDGGGLVTSAPAGITCGDSCAHAFPSGTTVVLTANAFVLSAFAGWSGDCAGADATCTVTLDRARTVRARFETTGHVVSVRKTGSGRVSSMPEGILCGADCREGYATGTMLTLTAVPAVGSVFGSWEGGGCSGTSPTCVITVERDVEITAHFMTPQFELVVTRDGTGAGLVTSTPSGIDCGATCAASFDRDTEVTLVAEPATASEFVGWSGACVGIGDCVVTMDAAKAVTATFLGITHAVTVSKAGNGAGRVTSTPSGIDCGADCAEDFGEGQQVELVAVADAGHAFAGWGGACAAAGTDPTCVVTVTEALAVSASFDIVAPWLLPLAPDASCLALFHFDAPSPLADACGGGPAISVGAWSAVASRNVVLDDAQQAIGPSEEAWIDTAELGPAPPRATIELTIKKSGGAFAGRARGVLYSNRDALDPSGSGLRVWVTNDGRLAAEARDGAGVTLTETAAGTIVNDRWYQVAATVSSTVGVALFVDGARVAETLGPVHFAASSSTAYAGAEREGAGAIDRFNGTIDELRVSSTVR